MAKSHDPSATATPAELPYPRLISWAVWGVLNTLGIAVFLVVPYIATMFIPILKTFPKVSTTVSWTVVQSAALAILLLLAMYCFGRARLEVDAHKGRRVDVVEFVDGRREKSGRSAKELTAGFKGKPNTSRIYNPTAVPGTAGADDFVQLVGNAVEAVPGGWWKMAARLVRLLRPPAAYRVTGTVVDSGSVGSHRLLVELVRLPGFAATPLIIEDDDWDRVLERAANSVAAQIFPVSRICKKHPQWASWWGYAFPTELFDAYQRAHQFQAERRYDQALAEFYRALKADPSNVYIRLEIGQLQERLDLHLDALVTYDDVITICSRDDSILSKWWNGPNFAPERSSARRRQRQVALLVARYRHALMLGHGDRIADQWWLRADVCVHEQHRDERQRQRDYLRAAVQRRFQRYKPLCHAESWQSENEQAQREVDQILSVDCPSTLDGAEARARAKVLRLYLCSLSQYEFERLIEDYSRYRRGIRLANRTLLDLVTARGLRLCLMWSVLRRAMARAEVGDSTVGHGPLWPATRAQTFPNLFARTLWPANQVALRAAITDALGRRTIWHEHYNVACVCSVALLPTGIAGRSGTPCPEDEAAATRRFGISHLHRAAAASHSGYLAGRRTWLLYEDPDLASLRGTPEFRNFELVTFSPRHAVPVRPRRLHVWELVSQQTRLIFNTADLMADLWRERRGAVRNAPPEGLRSWQKSEADAWRHIAQLAVSHRDWRTRHDCTRHLESLIKEHRRLMVDLGLPEYSERTLYLRYANAVSEKTLRVHRTGSNGSIDVINTIADGYIDACNQRMDRLANAILLAGGRRARPRCPNARGEAGSLAATKTLLISIVDLVDRPAKSLQRRCDARAELWSALASWFNDDVDGAPSVERAEDFEFRIR